MRGEFGHLGVAMIVEKPNANFCPARVERRRSKRFPVVGAVEVKWHGPSGVRIKETAQVEKANFHGGLLRMEKLPAVGDIIGLTNLLSAESVEARVLAMRGSTTDALQLVAIELFVCNE